MGTHNHRVKHFILQTGRRLGRLRYNHAFGVAMAIHAAAMIDRHYGTLNLIEAGTGISNVAVALAMAVGALLYLLSHPSSLMSLLGLFPHTFYAYFAAWYAVTTPGAPLGPPIFYTLALLTALSLFAGHHVGKIMVLLSMRWELDND